jgi:hypothetical protein
LFRASSGTSCSRSSRSTSSSIIEGIRGVHDS